MQRPKGKEILYNMTIGKHKELDLKIFVENFSNDTTLGSNEESLQETLIDQLRSRGSKLMSLGGNFN